MSEAGADGVTPAGPVGPRRAWALAFLAFFLLVGGWSLAAPLAGGPDEGDHVLRAYAAADGQLVPELVTTKNGTGARFTVPRGLVPSYCWQFDPRAPAACGGDPTGDRTLVEQDLIIGRHPPLYYAVVGLPLRLSSDWPGVLLARLVSAAICAALLATALLDALRWSHHRLLAVGVVVAVTPMAAHLAGSVGPNAVEIAAGVALAAAAVPLMRDPRAARAHPLLRHVALAAATMSMARVSGPLWVVVVLAALMLPPTRARLADWWRWRAARRWSAVVFAAMTASAAWTLTFHADNLGDYTGGIRYETVQTVRLALFHTRSWFDQMIGVMSWLDTTMPSLVYLAWEGAVAALLVWGFALADRDGRLTFLALGAGALGVPFTIQVLFINRTGPITAGRYLLPLAVGLPILAALLLQRSGLTATAGRSIVRVLTLTLLPLHLVCLAVTMVRWQHGETRDFAGGLAVLNPLAGPWHPPLGSVLPLAVTATGALLLGWIMLGSPVAAAVALPADDGADRDGADRDGAPPRSGQDSSGAAVA